ncbi:MAG: zinc-dependent metalloprotease [Cryomorphaceae bacterium]|nr:zinc-dependent metalloprotease [Cryomorphaceae bacterium]
MKKLYILIIIALFGIQNAFSQALCGTTFDSTLTEYYENYTPPEHYDSIFIRVYPVAIRDNNGEGGHPISHINQSLCILKQDFEVYNIFFDIQPIDTINNTQILNIDSLRPSTGNNWTLFDNLIFPFTKVDGISIFYVGNPYDTLTSSWARFERRSIFMGGSAVFRVPHTSTSLITHEMGHAFGLRHTFQSGGYSLLPNTCTSRSPFINPAMCAELVNGSNCDTCGDLICDTDADPGTMQEADRSCSGSLINYDSIVTYNCQYNWDYINALSINNPGMNNLNLLLYDANGDTLKPNMNNFMTYTYPRCMNQFSLEQINHMRFLIDVHGSLAHIQSNQQNFSSDLDLKIRSGTDDYGEEPYNKRFTLWKSPDIWVRNQPDGFQNQVHQNPYYDSINNNPVYVYVRVTNNSCENFLGDGHLKLYWAKASTALNWPSHWINAFQSGIPFGNLIDSVELNGISQWSEGVFEFEWHLENPEQYIGINPDPWHYCLLARIVSNEDPMTFPEISSLYTNVSNNNNIAWKNTTIVYPPQIANYSPGGVVSLGSVSEETETYKITFKTEPVNDHFLTEEAEVYFTLDEVSWNKWLEGGMLGENIEVYDEEKRKIQIIQDGAYLDGLSFFPMEQSTLMLSFNYLVDEVTFIEEFECNLIQQISEGEQEIIGGETYIVTKDLDRIPFDADAGYEQMIVLGDSVLLQAEDINEDAIYNWYINDTSKVFSGKQFFSYPDKTEVFKLEVIAKDGYKDYDSIKVQVKQYAITNINPNPAFDEVTISYRIKQNSGAHLLVLRSNGMIMTNQPLSHSNSSVTINVSNYPTGTYTAIIQTGNQNADYKNFIVQ